MKLHSGATKVNIGCRPRRAIVTALNELKKRLEPGRVYRRADLARWSNSIDRHLRQLVKTRALVEQSWGLYYCPRRTPSGEVPPDTGELIRAFLKDDRFLIIPRQAYNPLRMGTLRASKEETLVYNHKRHGMFVLGGHKFDFMVKPHFPDKISLEFLLVDLANVICLRAGGKSRNAVLEQIERKARRMNPRAMRETVKQYAGARAKKFFGQALGRE